MKQDFKVKNVQFFAEFHTAPLTTSRPNVKRNTGIFLTVINCIEYMERLYVRS